MTAFVYFPHQFAPLWASLNIVEEIIGFPMKSTESF